MNSSKRELQIPHNGRKVSIHQKQYFRPMEELFLSIRSKVSIQRKQIHLTIVNHLLDYKQTL